MHGSHGVLGSRHASDEKVEVQALLQGGETLVHLLEDLPW
jgi:hypothetical protein